MGRDATPSLFAPPTVAAARDRGLASAEAAGRHAGDDWLTQAVECIRVFARRRGDVPFAIEDAIKWACNDPRKISDPPDGRAWGCATQKAKRLGIIVAVGFVATRSSNGAPKVSWKRAGSSS